jgi:hypothetical protein
MDPELEAYVARAQDPALIPGIYNYCHHRCEQCAFTGRCFSFRQEQQEAHDHPERSLADHMEANFTRAAALMKAWCEQHGIDLGAVEEMREAGESGHDDGVERRGEGGRRRAATDGAKVFLRGVPHRRASE